MDKLEDWRKKIDIIDRQILNLLAKRVGLSQKIGKYKKEQELPLLDKTRWAKILNSNLEQAESLNLPKDFVKRLFNLIHKSSLKVQQDTNHD